ncbi:MAG: hypothetical protein MJZ28_01550 [Paludibacteraceae bacterium]|nr:hypothetical protein [Paludibacteraceae bacterium]
MRIQCFPLAALFLAFAPLTKADIDVTALFLQNAGFDDEAHFDYRKSDNGNVAQEILPVYGWTKDINVDYTITGTYEFGTNKTFNTYGKVPSAGYGNTQGGGLALSTGWDQAMKFFQNVTLPAGNYKLQTAFYNGSNSNDGYSMLGWLPREGTETLSSMDNFPSNQWKVDEVTFSLAQETTGRVQIGFKAVAGGSANSAKVVADFVKLYLVGNDNTLLSAIRSSLLKSLASAQDIYGNGTGKEAAQLKAAIDLHQATSENASASYVALFQANEAMLKAIEYYRWANATTENPSDFTSFITNPSFEEGFDGWTQSGLQTQKNTSFSLKSGSYYAEKWVEDGRTVGDIRIEQTLNSELPQGIYILKVAAQHLQNNTPNQKRLWIFAENDSVEVVAKQDYTLQFTHIEKSIRLGLYTNNPTGNWIACDNFRLYYAAASIDDYKRELSQRLDLAIDLSSQRMNALHRKNLQAAIEQAETWISSPSEENLATTADKLHKATEAAKSSAAVFGLLAERIATTSSLAEQENNDSEIVIALKKAEAAYNNESLTIADVNACIEMLDDALLFYQTSNATGPVPTVTTDPRHARGATMAFGRASFVGEGIVEKGFCWSTKNNPSIRDKRSTKSFANNGDIFVMEGLQPSTIYYIRPYALTNQNAVGYGKCIKICTLPMGGVTWSYNNGGSDEENKRINAAVGEACDIWNNLTSINGLHLTVNYGANTPTADCSYGGWMRVGPNASYQRTGTIQHEMAHAIGVGTIGRWNNDATYRAETSRGIWLGERTDQILQFLENDNNAHLKGDNTHFWPYGVNGAHEDTGSKMLYYANALIVQSLGEDNLPPVSGAFASPAYTFIQDDNEYYYILSADNVSGSNYTLVKSSLGGDVQLQQSDLKAALNDLSYAWQVRFNPVTQLYEFQNIQSEKSLANNSSRILLADQSHFDLQMLGSRENVVNQSFNLKSYWVTFADGSDKPNAMTASYNNLSATRFDHRNSASNQRWILLSRQEAKALVGGDFTELKRSSADNSSLIVYQTEDGLVLQSSDQGEWIVISDLQGRIITEFYMQAGMKITQAMQKGIYIVNGKKVIVQ